MRVEWNQPVVSRIILSVCVVLGPVMGLGWRLWREPEVSWAVSGSTMVTLTGERILQANVAAGDFDGDGDKELVAGAADGMLYVIAYNGSSWSIVWSRQTVDDLKAAGAPSGCVVTDRSEIRSGPAVADLDSDGDLEIIVTTGGNPGQHRHGGVLVYAFDRAWSFSVLPGWPQPATDEIGGGAGIREPDGCWDGTAASPAVGDLDGDGDLEVVTIALTRRIYAWHHNGTSVSGWPIWRDSGDNLLRGSESSPALGDIDGDGLPEVVVGTNSPPWDGASAPDYSKGTVWAINGDSSNVPGWPVTTENNMFSSPALGDIDADGQLEVVIGSAVSTEGGDGRRVYAWNGDGSLVTGWPKVTAGDMPASPALGDLDGDGDLEIVIGCGIELDPTHCTLLYAWHGDGSTVSGFPMVPPSNDPGFSDPRGLPYSPVLADYDGDGSVEILVVNWRTGGISTVESDGTPNNEAALQTVSVLFNSPFVDDVDNDGELEIVIGAATPTESKGAVYLWDVAGDSSAALPWPMFHHDVFRTGDYSFFLDSTPPQNPTVTSSTHVPGAWSNDSVVQLSWSGASDEESGIAGYYYLWDSSPTTTVDSSGSWLDSSRDAVFRELEDGASWYFHIRAVNRANMLADHTVHFGPLRIDTTPPVSAAKAPVCAVLSANVSWSGTDGGSGIINYDVQVRRQGDSSWTNWRFGTTHTSGAYSNATGNVYEFRSLAHDLAGNVETKSSSTHDAQTWLTQYGFSGTVHNVQDGPVFLADVTASPSVLLPATTDFKGGYLLCHEDAVSYSLSASRSDFGSLPAMKGLAGTLTGLDFYLPPADDAVVNGQFETGNLSGWVTSATGNGTVAVTGAAHTGDFAVELRGSSPIWTADLSQTIVIQDALERLALSLVYRAAGKDAAWVAVQGPAQTLTQPLPPSPTDWSHIWLDLSVFQGRPVTVGLHIDGSGSDEWLVVDEVSLGTPLSGVNPAYLPLVSRQN